MSSGGFEITGEPAVGGYIQVEELEIIETLPDSPVVFDVGANRGDFTRAVLERRPHATVYAFEPQAPAVALMARRFALDPRVKIRPWALGDEIGTREFLTDSEASQLGSFYPHPAAPIVQLRPIGPVMVNTVTNCMRQLERLDLLKIDAEGAELEILQGASMRLDDIETLYFECLDTSTLAAIEKTLAGRSLEIMGGGPLYISRRLP